MARPKFSAQAMHRLSACALKLWCLNGGSEAVWGGVLYPETERFHSGLEQRRGKSIRLRLPSGHHAHCQIEKVRAVAPQLVRVEGVSAPPFE